MLEPPSPNTLMSCYELCKVWHKDRELAIQLFKNLDMGYQEFKTLCKFHSWWDDSMQCLKSVKELDPFSDVMIKAGEELDIVVYQENRFDNAVYIKGSIDIRALICLCTKAGIEYKDMSIGPDVTGKGLIISFDGDR